MTIIGDTWTVVPCPGARQDELFRLVDECALDTDKLVVVTTDRDPFPADLLPHRVEVPWTGMRISLWWNVGLDYVADFLADDPGVPYQVFMPGSDVRGVSDSVEILAHFLRVSTLSMVGPDWHGLTTAGRNGMRFGPGSRRTTAERVPGACFMVAGEEGLRLDERFRWWYSDDDFEMQARYAKGSAVIAGTGLWHNTDHPLDEDQSRHAAENRALFVWKWGREPW